MAGTTYNYAQARKMLRPRGRWGEIDKRNCLNNGLLKEGGGLLMLVRKARRNKINEAVSLLDMGMPDGPGFLGPRLWLKEQNMVYRVELTQAQGFKIHQRSRAVGPRMVDTLGVMLKIMKPAKNSISGTFIRNEAGCEMKLGHQSGCSFFMFHDHFVTLWLHYFQHDPFERSAIQEINQAWRNF